MNKMIYIILGIIVGAFLSFIVHALIEIVYINMTDVDVKWAMYHGQPFCALPWWLIITLPILGIIFGTWLGLYLWKKRNKTS